MQRNSSTGGAPVQLGFVHPCFYKFIGVIVYSSCICNKCLFLHLHHLNRCVENCSLVASRLKLLMVRAALVL